MSKSHFKVISKIDLETVEVGTEIPESDFCSLTPSGQFVQLEHVEEEQRLEKYTVKPGIWSIKETPTGLKLFPTSFTEEDILETLVQTKKVTDNIDKFFSKIHVYKQFGIEVAKRGILLYGAPGCGKSSAIRKIAEKYAADQTTAIILWGTDKINPNDVKEFVKTFVYEGVDKLILVAEDIGGVEIDQVKMKSSSSLLSLLGNEEKAFTISTLIIATTNYPEVFLGNLTNRPGRFDVKIEVGNPDSTARKALLEFFMKDAATDKLKEQIGQKKYADFSAAHIREIALRSAINDISIGEAIDEIASEIKYYKDMFTKKAAFGIAQEDY